MGGIQLCGERGRERGAAENWSVRACVYSLERIRCSSLIDRLKLHNREGQAVAFQGQPVSAGEPVGRERTGECCK